MSTIKTPIQRPGNQTIALNILIGAIVLVIEPLLHFPPFPIPKWLSLTIGAILVLIYIVIVTQTSKSLPPEKQGTELVTTGLYSRVRHPLYAAIMIVFNIGVIFLFQSFLYIAALPVLWILWLHQINKEEREMKKLFGKSYEEYQNNTPKILPMRHKYPK